jgi:arsenate reductase
MAEAGVDMSTQRPKHLKDLVGIAFDWVITVCDSAKESCPVFPGNARHIHAGFDDPPRLGAGATSEETALAPYRRVRDEIRAYIAKLPELVTVPEAGDDTL